MAFSNYSATPQPFGAQLDPNDPNNSLMGQNPLVAALMAQQANQTPEAAPQDVSGSYAQDAAGVSQQAALAKMLMAQAQEPLQTNQMAGRFVVPVSPFQGLAKVAEGYLGGKAQASAEKKQADLQDRQSSIMALALKNPNATADELMALAGDKRLSPENQQTFLKYGFESKQAAQKAKAEAEQDALKAAATEKRDAAKAELDRLRDEARYDHMDAAQQRMFNQQTQIVGLQQAAMEGRLNQQLSAADARAAQNAPLEVVSDGKGGYKYATRSEARGQSAPAPSGTAGGKAPSGFTWNPEKPDELMPIPGGPKDPHNINLNQRDSLRANLVIGSAKNALDRLHELNTSHPAGTASPFLGVESSGVMGKAANEAGRYFLSDEQKNTDAAYSAMIDEAIPVFTGGLRGSDAFRQFLISQLPKKGDSKVTRDEKLRLFEENVKGIRNTFASKAVENPDFLQPGQEQSSVPITPQTIGNDPSKIHVVDW